MSSPETRWLPRYLAVRRSAEAAFWVVVLALQAGFNTAVTWIDLRSAGRALAPWQPALWEFSSALALLVLVPAVVWFERRFPLHSPLWRRHLLWHLGASVAFSLGHVVLMVALRHAGYAAAGLRYDFGDGAAQWGYEYLKDVRTYVLLLAALLSYRWFLLRLQGEARLLDAPDEPRDTPGDTPGDTPRDTPRYTPGEAAAAAPPPAPARPERFLVRKLRREFLIAPAEIEWLQAQGNYVGLHVRGHDYLLRSTLTDFLEQLDPARFARVHRSYAVNLGEVAEIEPLEAGDARLRMRGGSLVPCSRRYRDALGRPG